MGASQVSISLYQSQKVISMLVTLAMPGRIHRIAFQLPSTLLQILLLIPVLHAPEQTTHRNQSGYMPLQVVLHLLTTTAFICLLLHKPQRNDNWNVHA